MGHLVIKVQSPLVILKGLRKNEKLYFFSSRSKKLNATNLSVIRSTILEQLAKKGLFQWAPEGTKIGCIQYL